MARVPILRAFCEGWDAALFPRGPSPQLLLIPPFAESAKDGAPETCWQGKKDSPLPVERAAAKSRGRAPALRPTWLFRVCLDSLFPQQLIEWRNCQW